MGAVGEALVLALLKHTCRRCRRRPAAAPRAGDGPKIAAAVSVGSGAARVSSSRAPLRLNSSFALRGDLAMSTLNLALMHSVVVLPPPLARAAASKIAAAVSVGSGVTHAVDPSRIAQPTWRGRAAVPKSSAAAAPRGRRPRRSPPPSALAAAPRASARRAQHRPSSAMHSQPEGTAR